MPDRDVVALAGDLESIGRGERVDEGVTCDGADGAIDADARIALHRFPFRFFALPCPASLYAIATACFTGFPAATSVATFERIVFFELPFFSGIDSPPSLSLRALYVLRASSEFASRHPLSAATACASSRPVQPA